VATSVTGFPVHSTALPAHGVGMYRCLVLALQSRAYAFSSAGCLGADLRISAMIALYLNVFVLIAQVSRRCRP